MNEKQNFFLGLVVGLIAGLSLAYVYSVHPHYFSRQSRAEIIAAIGSSSVTEEAIERRFATVFAGTQKMFPFSLKQHSLAPQAVDADFWKELARTNKTEFDKMKEVFRASFLQVYSDGFTLDELIRLGTFTKSAVGVKLDENRTKYNDSFTAENQATTKAIQDLALAMYKIKFSSPEKSPVPTQTPTAIPPAKR